MAFTPEGVEYPVQTDVFDPAGDMQQLAESIPGVIVPVANTTERDAYAAAKPGTALAPIWVYRGDTKTLEVNEGTGWAPYVGATVHTVNGTGGTFTGSALIGELVLPAVPFNRVLNIEATIYCYNIVDIWNTALSLNQTGVVGAQRTYRLPSGVASVSASMALNIALPANTVGTVRSWIERANPAGSITVNNGGKLNAISVTAHRA